MVVMGKAEKDLLPYPWHEGGWHCCFGAGWGAAAKPQAFISARAGERIRSLILKNELGFSS
jgi:hypothetical protein